MFAMNFQLTTKQFPIKFFFPTCQKSKIEQSCKIFSSKLVRRWKKSLSFKAFYLKKMVFENQQVAFVVSDNA
jgi:hypothetical protein